MASRKSAKKTLTLAPKPIAPPPDLPTVDIEIDGTIYKACFDLTTLFESEEQLLRLGHADANLLQVFPSMTFPAARRLFAVAIQRFHPEIPFDDRIALFMKSVPAHYTVMEKLVELWDASMPKAKQGKKGNAAATADPSQASAGASAGG